MACLHGYSKPVHTKKAVELIFGENCLQRQICPISCNAAFVVDTESFGDRRDARRDSMGVWKKTHNYRPVSYVVTEDGVRSTSGSEGNVDFVAYRKTFSNKSHPQPKKIEVEVKDSSGTFLSRIFYQYRFDGEPTNVTVQPHGNSKKQVPFHPANKSLLSKIKNQLADNPKRKPERIYYEIMEDDGGIQASTSISSLPRDVKQVRNSKSEAHGASNCRTDDPHYTALLKMSMDEDNERF